MDIKMNDNETAFDIIQKLEKIDFEIIFITAYDKYAKQAFRVSALDFLEKPVNADDLAAAMAKYKKRKNQIIDPKQIELLLSIYL
jgi:two-component system LytT family response regulator